ncbi:hypothetical protein P9X10_01190 [Bacillus cereus]|nr:hypothetical protein [Bacillus cereus]
MMLQVVKNYKSDGELASIYVQDERVNPFAMFMNEEQFQVFVEKTGLILIDFGETNVGSKKKVTYLTNKDGIISYVTSIKDTSLPHKMIRGMSGDNEVDMQLIIEDNQLILLKPNVNCVEGFNPVKQDAIQFVLDYGTMKFVD